MTIQTWHTRSRRSRGPHAALLLCAAALLLPAALAGSDALAPGASVWLHAHNCYPEKGQWSDRLDRALATGVARLAIEQDIVWAADPETGRARPVVAHHPEDVTGREPSLEAHFFDRVRPLMERALREGHRERWPLLILHLDFKTNERAHHEAIWQLLERHRAWLTTAERTADPAAIAPLRAGPLLVLTENGEGQASVFHDRVPVGERLLLFGTVPPVTFPSASTPEARAAAIVEASPATLIPTGATGYRRWINFPWAAVERGGQAHAGAWTPADEARLRALTSRAHDMGLWIRFYTLNGHPAGQGSGWTDSYNFGSLEALQLRLRAAIAAGVEFIATDQYEELAGILRARR